MTRTIKKIFPMLSDCILALLWITQLRMCNIATTYGGHRNLIPALAKMNRIVVSQSTVQVLRRHRPVHSTVVKVHKRRRAARGPPALAAQVVYISWVRQKLVRLSCGPRAVPPALRRSARIPFPPPCYDIRRSDGISNHFALKFTDVVPTSHQIWRSQLQHWGTILARVEDFGSRFEREEIERLARWGDGGAAGGGGVPYTVYADPAPGGDGSRGGNQGEVCS